jgi:N-methylhydantoinase A/oxoprolinase/acetone carboxylase beta subunit
MAVVLGIDTGGTYTDAVIVNQKNGKILSSAKALTTRPDLSQGIHNAVTAVLKIGSKVISPQKISMVGLSTTLATNAIAENHGVPVCLLLIGYDRDLIHQYRFQDQLVTPHVVYIAGGHDLRGKPREPLDEEAIRQAVAKWSPEIDAFAVSGYFSGFNPEHEIRAREIIQAHTQLPVTCGHELSTKLNAVRRATTVVLNARLIPIIQDLIQKVSMTLKDLSIKAPLMVVKGDGSLVLEKWAVERPIETVLSGPAASALGALKLSKQKNIWAVDVGGTTTDIVELINGVPSINPDGASVGGLRTMVEAVDVYTIGLGGDSHVRLNAENQLCIGPGRVIPLCKLASQYPHSVIPFLKSQHDAEDTDLNAIQFLLAAKVNQARLSPKDTALIRTIKDAPQPLSRVLANAVRSDPWIDRRIQQLIATGVVQLAGFTPTDALHTLEYFQEWQSEAASLAAAIFCDYLKTPLTDFCQTVIQSVSQKTAQAVAAKAIIDETASSELHQTSVDGFLLNKALKQDSGGKLVSQIKLNSPVVALGAPVKAYMPKAANILMTALDIPEYAEVANAVGAASGETVQRITVRIRPISGSQRVRLLWQQGPTDFDELEKAVQYAQQHVAPLVVEKARQSGAVHIQTEIKRKDKTAKAKGNKVVFLESKLTFLALGRPGIAPNEKL